MLETYDAIRLLDLRLCDCNGPIERGIVARAIRHLETSLREHLTGGQRSDKPAEYPDMRMNVPDAC